MITMIFIMLTSIFRGIIHTTVPAILNMLMVILPSNGGRRDKVNPVHTIANSDHPYKGFDVNYDINLNICYHQLVDIFKHQTYCGKL